MNHLRGLPRLCLEVSSEMKFGDWLREQRKLVRLSQEALGESIGRSGGLISQLENGMNYSTKKPIQPTPEQLVDIVEALQSYGSDVTVHEAFTQAGIPIPVKHSENEEGNRMPVLPLGVHMPEGRLLLVRADDPMAEITGEGLILQVDPNTLNYRDRIKKPCVAVIQGEERFLHYMGEFATGNDLVHKFKSADGNEFTVPTDEATLLTILYLRINLTELH